MDYICSLANILTPFTAGTVWQRYHNGLQVVTDDFEFANTLELHGFACQIFLRCDCVGENVQKEGATARGVYPERNDITNHGLEKINRQNIVKSWGSKASPSATLSSNIFTKLAIHHDF